MCGIAGIYDFNNKRVPENKLKRMAQAIEHRGPDGEGVYVKDNIGFSFRRLAIIDLSSAGYQPMTNEDGRFIIVYNGELYNYLELKPELIAAGHTFHSKTDSEVVLHAYEEWGEQCLQKFKGVFAFAILDKKTKEVFLARDKFGTKPIYYTKHKNQFIFASEIKALLQNDIKRDINFTAFNEYFTFQNILSDNTLLEGIKLLPPANLMYIKPDGTIEQKEYWDFNIEEDHSVSEDDLVDRLRETFDKAVTRHLLADVPIGSYSSGGMDSGSIVAVASQKIPHLMTFTGGFDLSKAYGIEMVFDERQDSEVIARTFNTQHYEMVIHSGDMARVLPELMWHLEDPRVGMCYQNYYMAQLASKFVKVVLSGAGGDEMFGGYPWRYDIALQSNGANNFTEKYYNYWSRLIPDSDKKKYFSNHAIKEIGQHQTYDEFRSILGKAKDQSYINQALYFEAKTFLHGLCIVEDKVSFAHSLESRVPFLDDDIIEIARTTPAALKYKDGQGKYILRKALSYLLPDEIVKKKKQGFSTPDGSWYRGSSIDYVKDILLDKRTLSRDFFSAPAISKMLNEHASGKVNHRLLIWSLLSFEWWNRIFIDNEGFKKI